jgi:hypothetical protein
MTVGPPEGRDGGEAGSLGPIHVPDDISALEPDIVALRRERAALARRERILRLRQAPRWLRFGVAGPLIIAVLVAAGVSGALLSVPGVRQAPSVPDLSALAAPAVAPGSVGGLLPHATLDVTGGTVFTADLRPAVLALVPASCRGCGAAARNLLGQVSALQGQIMFVSTGSEARRQATELAAILPSAASTASDPDAVLARSYGLQNGQLTVLLVRSDGVVTGVLHGPSAGAHLETGFSLVPS